ncbi:MAG: hypothetical protein FJW79_00235 [Actinobacteria bacterium]|nr:hypothetical protein [Actinomycetota bacterium]
MHRLALVLPLILAAGCASAPASSGQLERPVRLLIAGTVDLSGDAAAVATADPEGIFREVRRAARRADLAVVAAADAEAGALLAAAGFDVVACPQPHSLDTGTPATPRLRCSGIPGPPDAWSPGPTLGLSVASPGLFRSAPEVTAAVGGGPPAATTSHSRFGRTSLTVAGLGALLSGDAAGGGALLEVLADAEGVLAYRLGRVAHRDFRVRFSGWALPGGDAVLLDGEWWALARSFDPVPVLRPPADLAFTRGDLVAAAVGDLTGDGDPDLVVSYRHPFRPSALSETRPGIVGVDSRGRSAHLGVFTLGGRARWAAGYLPRPVGELAVCDGAVALAYTALDDPEVVAAGAAVWDGLGLRPVRELPGFGEPRCADVDGDGRLDPVILGRSP